MAAVPYYDISAVKLDIRETGSGIDTELAHWNDKAEAYINDELYDKATKARRITSLPVLPFAAASVPETIQGAADAYVTYLYYLYVKNPEMAGGYLKETDKKITKYIERLKVDIEIYGRIAK